MQSYAMVPVTTAEGRMLGTLCAASASVHPTDGATLALMEIFSRLIADALEEHNGSAEARTVRVVVADDSAVARKLLRQVLGEDGGIEIVAEAADGREAVAACRAEQPDVVLLDLEMPEVDGLRAIPLLKEAAPSTRIVVLSAHGPSKRDEALQAGATAVIDKAADPAHLRSVVAALA